MGCCIYALVTNYSKTKKRKIMESEPKKSTNGHRTNGKRIYDVETGDKRS